MLANWKQERKEGHNRAFWRLIPSPGSPSLSTQQMSKKPQASLTWSEIIPKRPTKATDSLKRKITLEFPNPTFSSKSPSLLCE